MTNPLSEQVRKAGVVGAGGAGFPAAVKVSARAEIVIANGAECEPLLQVDQQVMARSAPEVVEGLELVREAVGAKRGIIALKKKYRAARDSLGAELARRSYPLELFLLESYYPAGDEQVLVADVTGRIIPEGGLPLDAGVVVNNVSTLVNIARAHRGEPVIRKTLTIAGEVKSPVTVTVPLGALVEDILPAAGGVTVEDYQILDGGPVMGSFTAGWVTKTTSGLIVLPSDHKQVLYRQRPLEIDIKKASWACDQCRTCTDYCPRYLLGHGLEPHLIMRLVGQQRWDAIPPADLAMAYLCCQCGACGMYACPLTLSPDRVIAALLPVLRGEGVKPTRGASGLSPHPFRDGRRIPVSRLAERIDVARYDRPAPLAREPFMVSRVRISLKQHVGAPCQPLVRRGDKVEAGRMIGDIPGGNLGAPIHASISGGVEQVFDDSIFIRGGE